MGRIKSNMTMEKFLRENEEPFLDQGNISFIAVGENDCPSGSKCEGYQLGGTYKLGEYNSKMLTTPNKKFSATAMRVFNHVDKARELKLGAQHKWGTVFTVKNKQKKVVA